MPYFPGDFHPEASAHDGRTKRSPREGAPERFARCAYASTNHHAPTFAALAPSVRLVVARLPQDGDRQD